MLLGCVRQAVARAVSCEVWCQGVDLCKQLICVSLKPNSQARVQANLPGQDLVEPCQGVNAKTLALANCVQLLKAATAAATRNKGGEHLSQQHQESSLFITTTVNAPVISGCAC